MQEITGRVIATKHERNTNSGNPRYTVALLTIHGGEILSTAPNAAIGYGITNKEYRDNIHTFTLNKRGQITGTIN